MAGYKETPRQKMISMMYLVLTAMLALNVSVEILNAFTTVNESVEQSNATLQSRIDETYNKFDQQYAINTSKVKENWTKAQELKQLSNELIGYINNMKYEVISLSEGFSIEEAKTAKLHLLSSKDNYDVPTNYFINNMHADSLQMRIENYKSDVKNILPEKVRDGFDLGLVTDGEYQNANGEMEDWKTHNFYHTVLAADVALLNKLIMDVQNTEYSIVNYLYSSLSEENFKFDKIDVKIIPKSNYVFVGENYEADVLVVAYDTTQSPTAYVKVGANVVDESDIKSATPFTSKKADGAVHLSIPSGNEGIKRFAGLLQMKSPTGDINTYHFSDEFIVAKPSMTVSASKMNVFYAGVDNPVSISVPGYGVAQLDVTISEGEIRREGSEWIVRVPESVKNTTINVSVDDNGKKMSMGSSEYRVKRVPSPTPKIANTSSGNISPNAMIAAGAIIPQMPEDFEFDYNFQITSFNFIGTRRGGDLFEERGSGNRLNNQMVEYIKNARSGDKIWIEDIVAKSPDGVTRSLSNISLVIQK